MEVGHSSAFARGNSQRATSSFVHSPLLEETPVSRFAARSYRRRSSLCSLSNSIVPMPHLGKRPAKSLGGLRPGPLRIESLDERIVLAVFSISDPVAVPEGNEGTSTLRYTVTLADPGAGSTTVNFA